MREINTLLIVATELLTVSPSLVSRPAGLTKISARKMSMKHTRALGVACAPLAFVIEVKYTIQKMLSNAYLNKGGMES